MANQISPLRILVVDDNHDAADLLAEFLMISGHEAHALYDGPSAIREASTTLPNVLFLDLGMPGMNGLEVAAELRSRPIMALTKLVALTAWGDDETRAKVRHAGFDQHLLKPACLDDILKSLN
jgi:CheY-like chemotaxis protein